MVKSALFPTFACFLAAASAASATSREPLDTTSPVPGAVRHRILKTKKKSDDYAIKEGKAAKAGKADTSTTSTCTDFSTISGALELFSYTLTIEISQLCEVDTPEEYEALENAICDYFNQAMLCAGCEEGVALLGCTVVIGELDSDDCPVNRNLDLAERELQFTYGTTTTIHIYGQARPPSTAPSLPGYPAINLGRRRTLKGVSAPSIKHSPERMLQNECPPVLLDFLQEPFPQVTDVEVVGEIEDIDICESEFECESEECCDKADCGETSTLCGCLLADCAYYGCFCDNEVKAEACQVYEESYSYGYQCETTTGSSISIGSTFDNCPEDQPLPNTACPAQMKSGTSCTYGQECCCGECSHSYSCTCLNGSFMCYYSDFCLSPDCVGEGETTTSSTGIGKGIGTLDCLSDERCDPEEPSCCGSCPNWSECCWGCGR